MNHNCFKKKKKPHRFTGTTFLQSLYLTIIFFIDNDLFSYASSCAFSFLFSFIPTVMMILVVLIRFLHATPDMFVDLFGENTQLMDFMNLDGVVRTIQGIKQITNFEIVIGIAIIWMARRFFSSIIAGVNKIFRQQLPQRPLLTQFIILAFEALLTILISAVIFLIVIFRTFIRLPFFEELKAQVPWLFGTFTRQLVYTTPYVMIFIMVTIAYSMGYRRRRVRGSAFFFSALSTFSFMTLQKLMHYFIDLNKYNVIYGVLSNTIVLLMEIFMFFVVFLFFGQYFFVYKFFDILLIAEMYLLPDYADTTAWATFKRMLFIKPDALMYKGNNVLNFAKGDYIYRQGDKGDGAFYLIRGTVQILHLNSVAYVDPGRFFGEEACMLEEIHTGDAVAQTDVQLVKIPDEVFFDLLESNPKVSAKALTRISKYFAKFYGRNDAFNV